LNSIRYTGHELTLCVTYTLKAAGMSAHVTEAMSMHHQQHDSQVQLSAATAAAAAAAAAAMHLLGRLLTQIAISCKWQATVLF
jgi:hypothetical protein